MSVKVHLTKEQQQAANAAKVKEAQALLASEVEKLVSGEDWQRYLELQARLHHYSPRNAMLIAVQHEAAYRDGRVAEPDPGLVAGYRAWQALGRQVEKGQKGYVVLAPVTYSSREAVNEAGNKRPLHRGEEPRVGEKVEQANGIRGWKTEHVWSVQQTSGAPLPEVPAPELLAGQAPPGLANFVTAVLAERGFRVEQVASAASIGGANGVTTWAEKLVQVRGDMDESAQVKTLAHELGHVLLHDPASQGSNLSRSQKEVEAESVAFVVCRAHGVSSDGYSFSYVANWAGEDAAKAVMATQSRVAKAAKQVLDASPLLHSSGGRPPVPSPEPEVPAAGPTSPAMTLEVA
jgi:hypothetical protein